MLLPLAALLALAGAFGLYLGVVMAPPSESEIIARHAAEYVAETGRALSDCYGVPSGIEGVHLIVVCEAEGEEAWFVAVDARGVPVDEALVLGEDAT
ncbi:hypothetical protein [Gymnodinialimonas ceratoperidinii]|uniref:Uncharacterized protein n=1 Tax=Gymnodinialimonas ceratoperidinii TaxID=2856823 RepID=A0A8F6TVZ4_9RHOB|nr:hypothetical protein [Gymnodinialimonas ceratoperidinii]QXT39199.1 hypothetical protein KYE46_14905 [Gymnodinialimonas ceratoperidinii]